MNDHELDILTSSNKTEWSTPQKFFDTLNEEFWFDVDFAATAENAKCKEYFSEEQDALKQDWSSYKVGFLNPPYGRYLTGKWIKKAYEESLKGTVVVCLIPSRTDTIWWHEYVSKASEIRFIKGRLHFNDAEDPSVFPSAVVVFDQKRYLSNGKLQIVKYWNFKASQTA